MLHLFFCEWTWNLMKANWNCHFQETEDAAKRHRVALTEIDSRLQREYDKQRADALQQIRDERNEMIRRNREEVEASYEKRVSNNFYCPTELHYVIRYRLYFSTTHLKQLILWKSLRCVSDSCGSATAFHCLPEDDLNFLWIFLLHILLKKNIILQFLDTIRTHL